MNTFNVEKAAQITAYFALRAGGSIDELKVLKLVYIAERAYLDAYELPLTGDTLHQQKSFGRDYRARPLHRTTKALPSQRIVTDCNGLGTRARRPRLSLEQEAHRLRNGLKE